MTLAHKAHDEVLAALRDKRFEKLVVKRFEGMHYLIVTVAVRSHVYADHAGRKKEYRHAWQIESWLESTFGIKPESIVFEEIGRLSKGPNQPPEPTVMSVTPPAGQEPRQP